MKILVAYSSKTGNTKKVAQAINEVVQGDLVDISDQPNIDKYDAIIIGYWTDKGVADKLADEFLDKIKNKPCGVFATLGANPDSEYGRNIINYGIKKLEENNCTVLSSFICQGKINPLMTAKLEKSNYDKLSSKDKARMKIHKDASTHPDDDDLKAAKKIFKNFRENLSNY